MKTKLTFLGTGASKGIPQINCECNTCLSDDQKDKRLRTSLLIQTENQNFVIDCGPDFRQQMLSTHCKNLSGILFTHEHNDHINGLVDIRPFYEKQGDIQVYGKKRVLDSLKQTFRYMFNPNKGNTIPSVITNEVDTEPFNIKGFEFIPLQIIHGRLPILGYKFQNIAYITDASIIPTEEKEKLQNLDVLIINAFRIKEHFVHFNLVQALELVEEIKPKKAYFIHINHGLGLHNEIQKQLPKNIFLAYDGLSIEV